VIRMLEGKIAQMVNRRSTRVSDATEGLLPYAILGAWPKSHRGRFRFSSTRTILTRFSPGGTGILPAQPAPLGWTPHSSVVAEQQARNRCRECQLAVSAISGSGPGLVLSFRSRPTLRQVSGAVTTGMM